MAKYNPFDPANGYSEEDRLALNGKCASLINQAYKNPFPGTKIRLDGADNAGIKSAPMGAQALVIHTGNIYIADSTGKFYPM